MTESFEKYCFNQNEITENVKKKKLVATVRLKLLGGKFNLELILFVTCQKNKELALRASFVILTSANSNSQTKAALLFLKLG